MHYVPIQCSGQNDCTTSVYNVKGRKSHNKNNNNNNVIEHAQGKMNALRPNTMFRVEGMQYTLYNVQDGENALRPYTIFRVE